MPKFDPDRAQRWADMAEELAGVGYWWMDASSQAIHWSPNMFRIFGVDPAVQPTLDYAMQFVHEDDRAAAESNLEISLVGASTPTETRIVRPSGEIRFVEGRNGCEYGPKGDVLAVYGTVLDVTARKTAELAIVESEARYRLLADAASDVVLKVDADDCIQYVSPSVRRFGWSPESMIGKRGASFIHPDDLERVLAGVDRLKQLQVANSGADRCYRIRNGDGTYTWIEASSSAIHNPDGSTLAVICQLRDVSERRAASLALAESEARYRLLANHSTDIIVRLGRNGIISYASPSVEALGYQPCDVVGRSTLDFVLPEDREFARRTIEDLLSGNEPDRTILREYRVALRDGSHIWMEGNPTVIQGESGNAVEVVTSFRNITARKDLEARLVEASVQANAAARAKADFLANMSHELRTLLSAILGFTRLLGAQTDLSDIVRHYVNRIDSAGRVLTSTINDVLDFSRLEAGRIEIHRESVALTGLLEDIVGLFDEQARDKNLNLALRVSNTMPKTLLLDPTRISQILVNLLGNAVKFTDAGQIVLEADFDQDLSQLTLAVSDTGPGISKAAQLQLFQRFSQVDGSSARSHGGTGLGLAICKGLASAMQGSIGVESDVGQGARFWISIEADPTGSTGKGARDTAGEAVSLHDCRILVVGDNAADQELLRKILTGAGATISMSGDGARAIQLAKLAPFDIILVDLHLPDLGGIVVAGLIRHGGGPNVDIPIVALTAEPAGVGPLTDFDGVVAKPFEIGALVSAIERALKFEEATLAEFT